MSEPLASTDDYVLYCVHRWNYCLLSVICHNISHKDLSIRIIRCVDSGVETQFDSLAINSTKSFNQTSFVDLFSLGKLRLGAKEIQYMPRYFYTLDEYIPSTTYNSHCLHQVRYQHALSLAR